MSHNYRPFFVLLLALVASCAAQGQKASVEESVSVSPELRTLIAEVQSEYMNCMVPKLPAYDDSGSDIETVAAALRDACRSEAASGAEKLRSVDASTAFQDALAQEFLDSLEGHSTRLVIRWRKHLLYREPPGPAVRG